MSNAKKKSVNKKKSKVSEKKNAEFIINSLRELGDKFFGKDQPVIIQSFSFDGNVKNVIFNTLYPNLLKEKNISLMNGNQYPTSRDLAFEMVDVLVKENKKLTKKIGGKNGK